MNTSFHVNGEAADLPFNEERAELRKKEIARAIRPTEGIRSLPPLLTPPRRVMLIVPPSTLEEQVGRLSGGAGELPMLGLAFIGPLCAIRAMW